MIVKTSIEKKHLFIGLIVTYKHIHTQISICGKKDIWQLSVENQKLENLKIFFFYLIF